MYMQSVGQVPVVIQYLQSLLKMEPITEGNNELFANIRHNKMKTYTTTGQRAARICEEQ